MSTDWITSLHEWFVDMFAALSAGGAVFFTLVCIVLALLWVYFIRIHIAMRMAKNRHRDPLGWVLLSLFVSPILTWIVLLIAGDAK